MIDAATVTMVVGVVQLVGGVALVPFLKRQVSALRSAVGGLNAEVGALRHEVAAVDAMISHARQGVEMLVRDSLDRKAEWENAVKQ